MTCGDRHVSKGYAKENYYALTHLKFSHVFKDLFTVFSNHANVPCFFFNIFGLAGLLHLDSCLLQFTLNSEGHLGLKQRCRAASCHVPRAEGVGSGVSLVLIIIVFIILIPILFWLRESWRGSIRIVGRHDSGFLRYLGQPRRHLEVVFDLHRLACSLHRDRSRPVTISLGFWR